ncbi:MAG TPA: tetratricopeptide repeat protein [Gemmataceae bacterium]|nr:tetratricopeptide repeat protein [Gemmataceae bacterium]
MNRPLVERVESVEEVPAAGAGQLRRFCTAILELLDASGETTALPRELARVIGAGVAEVADGLRREVAACDAAIAQLRNLLPARFLGLAPGMPAVLAELESARGIAARITGALDALQEAAPQRGDDRPHPPAPISDRPAEPVAHYDLLSGDTAEVLLGAPTEETSRPVDTGQAARVFLDAETHRRRREFDRAIALYTDAIRADPRFGPAYSRRGQVRLAQGEIDAAVADFDAALGFDQTAAEAWWWRGDAHAVAGRIDAAVADFTRALDLRPDLTRARFNLAVALRRRGEADRALAEFDKVIESRPGSPAAYLNRGLIHLHRGEANRAAAEFRLALRYDPSCEPAREHLAALAAPPPSPPPPPAPAAKSGTTTQPAKKEAGQMVVNCPGCGHPGEVPWDRLGKVFICTACGKRFGVKPDGKAVELVGAADGRWVEAAKAREQARLRRKRRLGVAGVVLAAALLPGIAFAGWRVARTTAEPAEPELPTELTPRVELFTRAWLCNDVRLMKRLTTPAQDRAVFSWYVRHRPAPALRSPTDGTPPDGARIDISHSPGKPGQEVVRIRVSNPKTAPDQPPAELTLIWEQRGDTWYFLPPAK